MPHSIKSKVPGILDNSPDHILVCCNRAMTENQILNWLDSKLPKLKIRKRWNLFPSLNPECREVHGHNVHYFLKPKEGHAAVSKTELNKHADSKGREYIGTATLSSGVKVKVFMPLFGDLIVATSNPQNAILMLYVAATGMSEDELMQLPIHDGTRISELLNPAIESMNTYMKPKGE